MTKFDVEAFIDRTRISSTQAVALVEAVLGSPLWRRAQASAACHAEVPFALRVDGGELGLPPGEVVLEGVVDLAFAQECTGAGGQYLLAREIDGFRAFWVGAHACQFAEGGTNAFGIVYGVVRYRLTAGLQEIPPEVCVGFPDEPPGLQTDATTLAIAVFEQLSEAQAFEASL